MSEDPDSEEVSFDSAAFEEWVEKTAENKNIPRGEVLDQMLSSYWILEELTGMMDDGGQGGPTSNLGQSTIGGEAGSDDPDASADKNDDDTNASGRERDATDENGSAELIREFQQLRSAILELSERQDAGEQQPRSDARVDDSSVSPFSQDRTDDRLRRTLSDLQERVEDLSDELSEVEEKHDRDVADLEGDIEETLETLETLESSVDDLIGHSELESLAVSLEEELSRIEETTAELDGRLAQLEEVHSETAGEVADLADGQSDLEARLDREFNSIENLFQHLLDKTDDLEYRLDAVSDSHEEDIASVEEGVAEHERLGAIMREAHRQGITSAVCDSCETKVNLQLLHEPYCPECDRSITGVKPGGWLPFDKPTLETEPIQSASDGLGDGSPDPSDLLGSPPDDDSRT